MLFGKFNRSVVINDEHMVDAVRALNELGISEFEFAELGLGKSGLWCVMFHSKKKAFAKFLTKVRVEHISCR